MSIYAHCCICGGPIRTDAPDSGGYDAGLRRCWHRSCWTPEIRARWEQSVAEFLDWCEWRRGAGAAQGRLL